MASVTMVSWRHRQFPINHALKDTLKVYFVQQEISGLCNDNLQNLQLVSCRACRPSWLVRRPTPWLEQQLSLKMNPQQVCQSRLRGRRRGWWPAGQSARQGRLGDTQLR